MKHQMLSIQATPDTSAIRVGELLDQEYTIVPCIALVEGVLWPMNAPHPELALAEEFGRFPEGWDGRPLVMNHPQVDGVPVSAGTPGVLEAYSLGQIFNTTLDDDKLKTELWINNARVAELGGEFQETVDRLIAGTEVVEVSTGLFTMQEMVEGEHDGEVYNAIWRNIVPDHLALLSEGSTGACSVKDGCGAPRSNSEFKPCMQAIAMRDNGSDEAPVIHDHQGTDCECGGECQECQDNAVRLQANEDGKTSLFKRLMEMAGGVFEFTADMKDNTLSDRDIRTALNIALEASTDEMTWVVAIFQEGDTGQVIYELGWDGMLFSRDFSIAGDAGAISLGPDPLAVRPVTQFVPMEVSASDNPQVNEQPARENAMDIEQFVSSLISNEATQFTADDKEWLSALSEEQLEKLQPTEVEEAPAEPVVENNADGDEDEAAVSAEDYIAGAPEEIQEVLNQGLAMQRDTRNRIITGLIGNSRNKFTQVQLEGMPLDQLQNIADLANVVSFAGNGNSADIRSNGEQPEEVFTEAPSLLANLNTQDAQ